MKKILLILSLLLFATSMSQAQADFYVSVFANPGVIMEHSTTTLFANAMGADGEVSYEWTPSDGIENPYSYKISVKPKTTTTYTVTATCGDKVATAQQIVYVVEIPKNLRTTVEDNNVILEWDKVEYADCYIVYRNEVPLSTFVNDNYYVDEGLDNGRYCYMVKAEREGDNTPDSRVACVDIDMTDVEDITIDEVTIFPNPTKDVINVKTRQIDSFSIYNMMGQMLMNENVESGMITIDIGGFDPGMYLLYVETESEIITRKINIIK